ncbi:MAG TPA: nitroreductase family protein [Candidatus Angelobacter sp.]|nr:nitroreductase family protein [Candidatus Angelobacter sp.]
MHADRPDPHAIVRPLLRARQVRQFTDEAVDAAALDALADVGRWSGSSKNNQPWRFIVISQRETLRRLADPGMPFTRALQSAAAGIAISLPEQPGWKISHAYDEGRAAERILIAASMLGLGAGIAWLSDDARAAASEILGLPEDRFVRTVIALGHPTDEARRPKSERGDARLPREETVFAGRWPTGE